MRISENALVELCLIRFGMCEQDRRNHLASGYNNCPYIRGVRISHTGIHGLMYGVMYVYT